MGRLDRQLRENMERNEENKSKKTKRKSVINTSAPAYDLYGNSNDKVVVKKKINYKKIAIPAIVVFAVAMIIYLPQILYKGEANTEFFDKAADSSAIKLSAQYIKDCPDEDFDGDGLANYKEEEYGCNPFAKDSDRDGISDYAEVTTYKTSPVKTNSTLVNYLKQSDAEKGNTIDTPYKMGDVVLWADSYTDKAYGGVIETFGGYRFHDFNGWAKFPSGKYAYKYENGRHELLEHRSKEDVWRIDEDMVVLVYDKELDMSVNFTLFGKDFFVKSNIFTDFIAFLLPNDAGLLKGQKIAKIDADPNISSDSLADFKLPNYNENELERFGTSFDSLHVLIKVREFIDNNQTVAVSLYSSSRGENIGVVTGYTSDGRLIVCNESGDFLGYIIIYEKAAYMLNEKQQLVTRQWFTFDGLGYSSSNWDRISFFGVSDSDNSNIGDDKQNSDSDTKNDETESGAENPQEGTEEETTKPEESGNDATNVMTPNDGSGSDIQDEISETIDEIEDEMYVE